MHSLAIFDFFSGPELLVVMALVLIFFGGEKLPEFARGLGKVMREVRKAASEVEREFKAAMDESERKAAPPPPHRGIVPAAFPPHPPQPGAPGPPIEAATDPESSPLPPAPPTTEPPAGPSPAASS